MDEFIKSLNPNYEFVQYHIKDKKVVLLVNTRKMFCNNPSCTHKTFSEKHPFVEPKAKKTNRLIKNIINTSVQLSSLNASKLLKSEHITACKSSICSLLKKMPSIVDKSSVKLVCVDDFALQQQQIHILMQHKLVIDFT